MVKSHAVLIRVIRALLPLSIHCNYLKIPDNLSQDNDVRQTMEGVIEAAPGRRADDQERVGPGIGDNRPDCSGCRFDLGFGCLRARGQRRQGHRWTSRLHLLPYRRYRFGVCRLVSIIYVQLYSIMMCARIALILCLSGQVVGVFPIKNRNFQFVCCWFFL